MIHYIRPPSQTRYTVYSSHCFPIFLYSTHFSLPVVVVGGLKFYSDSIFFIFHQLPLVRYPRTQWPPILGTGYTGSLPRPTPVATPALKHSANVTCLCKAICLSWRNQHGGACRVPSSTSRMLRPLSWHVLNLQYMYRSPQHDNVVMFVWFLLETLNNYDNSDHQTIRPLSLHQRQSLFS